MATTFFVSVLKPFVLYVNGKSFRCFVYQSLHITRFHLEIQFSTHLSNDCVRLLCDYRSFEMMGKFKVAEAAAMATITRKSYAQITRYF